MSIFIQFSVLSHRKMFHLPIQLIFFKMFIHNFGKFCFWFFSLFFKLKNLKLFNYFSTMYWNIIRFSFSFIWKIQFSFCIITLNNVFKAQNYIFANFCFLLFIFFIGYFSIFWILYIITMMLKIWRTYIPRTWCPLRKLIRSWI